MSDPVIKPGSLVLVTGVNGFIGSHIADQILHYGYRVRGTTRNIPRDQWLEEFFEKKYGPGKFELVEVPDMLADGAFDEVVKGVSGLVHVAAPVMISPDPHAVIPFVVDSTMRILEAAAKEPGMKRVVLTSSSGSCAYLDGTQVFAIDSNMWNEACVEAAYAPPPYEGMTRIEKVYQASKTKQEQEAWKWVREHKPSFVFNAVLPNANLGPPLDVVHQGYRSTIDWIKTAFEKGENLKVKEDLFGFSPQYYVDVRDNAAVHVAALVYPDVEGERLFAFSQPFNANDILKTLKKIYPDRKFAEEEPNAAVERSTVTNGRAEELLKRITGHGWTSFEDSIRDAAKGLSG
ncbi:NAD(P)-binding protein [Annulohypoxylon truncatum]|uniref:NAD(P)-binding protein n=1 Tax=Annulohypoxylon truncatum TaxID=327061 RepID=UPI002008BF5B|nr:NAD(P)-binding protein [Annulohypoxylon truncatum]KAI1209194.1 NAD(P)-binding protein [Annulohypoxylon truncatum]